LPRRLDGILDGTSIASGEISHDHHVLDESSRHAEGPRELPQYKGAIVELGSDYHMSVVKLASDKSAVVPPLGQPAHDGAENTVPRLGQPAHLAQLQHCPLLCSSMP
jgi:hypothetical protein